MAGRSGALRLGASQDLLRIEKAADGSVTKHVVLPVAFVPLVTQPQD